MDTVAFVEGAELRSGGSANRRRVGLGRIASARGVAVSSVCGWSNDRATAAVDGLMPAAVLLTKVLLAKVLLVNRGGWPCRPCIDCGHSF